MPTAVYNGSGGSFPPIVAPPPQSGITGDHVMTLTDATTGRTIGGRARIDGSIIRATDAGGRIQVPQSILRPGARELKFEAPGHESQTMRITVAGRLQLRIAMTRTGVAPAPAPDPGGGDLGPISLAWGPVLGDGDDATNVARLDEESEAAGLDSDQPTSETDIEISNTFSGAVAAILSGVAAGTAVSWSITPVDLAGAGTSIWIAAGPCLVSYWQSTHASGSYTVTATVADETYGPITLTVLES